MWCCQWSLSWNQTYSGSFPVTKDNKQAHEFLVTAHSSGSSNQAILIVHYQTYSGSFPVTKDNKQADEFTLLTAQTKQYYLSTTKLTQVASLLPRQQTGTWFPCYIQLTLLTAQTKQYYLSTTRLTQVASLLPKTTNRHMNSLLHTAHSSDSSDQAILSVHYRTYSGSFPVTKDNKQAHEFLVTYSSLSWLHRPSNTICPLPNLLR